MKIELKATEDVKEKVKDLATRVADKKQKQYKPGKYVLVDTEGKVKKVITLTGEGKTEQSYKDDLDINRLLEPAMKKGLLRHVTTFVGEYDDIPFDSFQDAQFIVAKGKNMFEALPSKIRTKFGTPDKFMEYVQNPENKQWLIDNGVLKGLDGVDGKGTPTGYNPNQKIPDPPDPEPKAASAD